MSSTTQNLIDLCERICAHEGVSHWAISMRLFGKGDFFHRIKKRGSRPYADTIEKGIRALSDSWPDDLEWPQQVARPVQSADQKGGFRQC